MKTIHWGILGCGGIANKFAEALQRVDDSVLGAVGARHTNRAADFAKKWNFQRSYGSYIELANDPDIDIIYIATPHSYHFAHTKLCLEAGKHVLCEKPFTINADQLNILIDLAKENGLFLMEALWTKCMPGILKVQQLIEQGVIGKPVSLEADFGMNVPFNPEHRIYNPLLGGGALLDIGIYPLFLSLALFDDPVKTLASSVLHENGVDLITSLILESASGTVSHLNSNVLASTPVKAKIFGTKGSIEFDNWWFTPVNIELNANGQTTTLKFPPIVNGYEYEAIEAVKCLQEGKLESDLVPHSFSLMLMNKMDEIREICNIVYPGEIEDTKIPYGWSEL